MKLTLLRMNITMLIISGHGITITVNLNQHTGEAYMRHVMILKDLIHILGKCWDSSESQHGGKHNTALTIVLLILHCGMI